MTMGIFRKNATGEIGRFRSPYSVAETIQVVHAGLAGQLTDPTPRVSTAGPLPTIFISRLDDTGLTVTAGNLVETYFTFTTDLTAVPGGCAGSAYFDRPSRQIHRWFGNVIGITAGVGTALRDASVRVDSWRTNF